MAHEMTWQRHTEGEAQTGACVLLAVRERVGSDIVWRARELANLLDLPLSIVRVIESDAHASWRMFQTRLLARFVEVARSSTHEYQVLLGEDFDHDRLSIRVGGFAEEVELHAEQVSADSIVVPTGQLTGAQVTALARATRRSVWVVHPQRGESSTIVAATDLASRDYPVLESAGLLSERLHVPLIAVHHAPRSLIARAMSALRDGRRALREARLRKIELEQIRAGLGAAGAVLLRENDCASAIIAQANRAGADTIVVGTHVRRPVARVVHRSVAVTIVNRAGRSVLVLPVDIGSSQASSDGLS